MTLYQMCIHIQNVSLNIHISSHCNGVQCVEFGCRLDIQIELLDKQEIKVGIQL
jgi:hypothetical protein